MKRVLILSLVTGVLACSGADRDPTSPNITLDVLLNHAGSSMRSLNFVAPSSGDQEVPARETGARANATFHVSADGNSISYRLIVANIENVVASHIHVGLPGVNGPVVVWLYGPEDPAGGRLDGVIATGTFTSADFVGPLAGASMSDLIALMQSGGAYVNVHTNDGVAPPNTGPGDFPGGEVRGVILGGHGH